MDSLLRVPQPGAAGLSAEAVSVKLQGLTAPSDVRLTVLRGAVVGLIGPNGAGKTTLVNCFASFQRPPIGAALKAGGGKVKSAFRYKLRRRGT